MLGKLKQFRDLRAKAKTMQSVLADVHVEGSASFGKIKIKMDGNQTVHEVLIDDSLISLNVKDKLQKACAEAFNDAVKKGHRKMAEAMKGIDGFDFSSLGGGKNS